MIQVKKQPLLLGLLAILFFSLQAKIWFGDGSVSDYYTLKQKVENMRATVETEQERNAMLEAEIENLKDRLDAIEERARSDLGMIQIGERFFYFPKSETKK